VTDNVVDFEAWQDPDGMWWFPDTNPAEAEIGTTWYVDPQFEGAYLKLTVIGLVSGATAEIDFKDTATVTPASGGTNISADKAANAASPAYSTLGNIVIDENANNDFARNQNNTTLILSAPNGWRFNAGTGGVSYISGRDITAVSIAVTTTTLTVTLSTQNGANGDNADDVLTISGIQVRATNGGAIPSSETITRTGGTASIAGAVVNSTNFGSLSQVPGVTGNFTVSGFPTSVAPGTSGSVTVTAKDQFGNTVNSGPNQFLGTVTLSSSDGAASLPAPHAYVAADVGVFTFTGVTLNTAGTQSLTATSGALTGSQSGIAVTEPHFTSVISPVSVTYGDSDSYTITITNSDGGADSLGSVIVAIPSSMGSLTAPSVVATDPGPNPRSWSVSIVGSEIRAMRTGTDVTDIDTGGKVLITFSATATSAGSATWATQAFAGSGFSGMTLAITGTQPGVTVNQRALTITANDQNKTYGNSFLFAGTEFTSGAGQLVDTDSVSSVTLSSDGAPATSTRTGAGPDYDIVASGASGLGLDNYDITYVAGHLHIQKRTLTITAEDQFKTYGDIIVFSGEEFSTGVGQLVNGDSVTGVLLTSAGSSATAPVSSPSPGYAIAPSAALGSGLGNYEIIYVEGNLHVNRRAITVTAVPFTKVYDGGLLTSATPLITSGTLANDDSPMFHQRFDSKHVGTGKTLVPSGHVNDDNGGSNYLVNFVNDTSGVITAAALAISAAIDAKDYDGTTGSSGIPTVSGLQSGDAVTGLAQAFLSKNVLGPLGSTLQVTAHTVDDGNGGNNYLVETMTAAGTITRSSLMIIAQTDTKAFDGTVNAAALPTVSGLKPGDFVTGLSETYDTPDQGTGKTLSVATYTLDDGNLGANYLVTTVSDPTGVITPAPVTSSLSVASTSVQYSDLLNVTVTLSPGRVFGHDPATGVQFRLDGANLGIVLALAESGSDLTASLTTSILMAPGAHWVTAEFTNVNANFTVQDPTAQSITVEPEYARVEYTGPSRVSTSSASSRSFSTVLTASIRDITAESDEPAFDANAGAIANARVTFVNRATGNPIAPGAVNLPVSATTDPTVGNVHFAWTDSIASDVQDFVIGIVVSNFYTRNSTSDDVVLTVARPVIESINGRGAIVNHSPTGSYAPDSGLRTTFGFSAESNRSLNRIQGKVTILLRRGGRTYLIRNAAMDSLTIPSMSPVGTVPALLICKATLTDMTDKLNPIPLIESESTQLILAVTDRGEPGRMDSIAIVFRDSRTGEVFYASHASATTIVEQSLSSGNIQVRRATEPAEVGQLSVEPSANRGADSSDPAPARATKIPVGLYTGVVDRAIDAMSTRPGRLKRPRGR
jgi:hypothetical protein